MKTDNMVEMLNAEQAEMPWTIDPSLNDGYPGFVSEVVSINDYAASDVSVAVFPTVTDRVLNLSSDSYLTYYTIYSSTGNLVKQGPLAGNAQSIDLGKIPAGLYLITTHTNSGAAVHKIIKN